MTATFRQPLLVAAAACTSAMIAACGGGGGGGVVPVACSPTSQKNFVLNAAREWYLFLELLPATVDVNAYATAQELLDALTATARSQNKDRFFSYLTTPAADSSFLSEGQFIGFGFRTRIDGGNRLLVPDVYEGSPAAQGGLGRGSEITHIDSGAGFVPVATILQTDPNLEQAFGPPTQGVQRGLRFTPAGTSQTVTAVLTKAIVTIPPVPANGTAVLALPNSPNVAVGYVNLRTFISTAETPLLNAFQQFQNQGIQYFIFDLRYNGGGLVSTADLVGDLFGGGQDGNVFERMRFNASKSSNDSVHLFDEQPQSVTPVRIAFITTGSSASASELVVNSMKPWVEVAIVGSDTYGKPVGQSAFDLAGCDLRLRLVSFKITNALNQGDYFDGLAPTLPFACAASDDLARNPWDSMEASTAAALSWLETGACGQVMSTPPGLALKAQAGVRVPLMRRPTPAQDALPGLF